MSKREILAMPYGEMLDMIACLFIDEGRAKAKKPKMRMEDVLMME